MATIPKSTEDSEISQNKILAKNNENNKFINRIPLQQRIAYISNDLASSPLIWCLYDTVSDSPSFDELENNALKGAYSTAKDFAKSITKLIANERECIFADTSLATERLLSFRAIKKRLLNIQSVLHGVEGPLDSSYLDPVIDYLSDLNLTKLQYSSNHTYINMKIGDDVILEKAKVELINQVSYNGLHSPIFKLIKSMGQGGYNWSEGNEIYVVRLYIANNKSRLATAGKDPQTLCLLDVRLGSAPYNASLVVKPIGSCYEVLDEGNFALGSPIGWIWAVILSIEVTSHPSSRSNKFHVPVTFTKSTTLLAKATHSYLFEWFEKRKTVLSSESVAF